MTITLEQIDEVIARTNVSYHEAKEALQETDGDVLEALLYLEKSNQGSKKNTKDTSQNKSQTEKDTDFKEKRRAHRREKHKKFKSQFKRFMGINVGVFKNNKKSMTIPAWLIVLGTLLFHDAMAFIFIIGLLLALIGPYEFKLID